MISKESVAEGNKTPRKAKAKMIKNSAQKSLRHQTMVTRNVS